MRRLYALNPIYFQNSFSLCKKTNKKDADEFVRMLVSNIMGDLQDKDEFSPQNLEKALAQELADFEKMSSKKTA